MFSSRMIPSRRRIALTSSLLAVAAAMALSSCSPSSGAVRAEDSVTTITAAPLPPSSIDTTTSVTTTTVEPTTTAAPTTTESTTTTSTVPPTTVPPTTLPPNVEPIAPMAVPLEAVGSRSGEATKAVQQRLLDLGFWLAGVDGEYGLTTKQAVMAFQKYLGLPATGKVDDDTAAYMANLTERAHGAADTGDLVEVDKTRQLIFVIRGGKTMLVLNTSTATGLPYEEEDRNTPGEIQRGVSITPNGLWKVDRERPEGWWEGDLGEIYRPKYFKGGVAVHGSNSIPNYPASHGCVRVSVPAMDMIWFYDLMPMRSVVWVHGEFPQPA